MGEVRHGWSGRWRREGLEGGGRRGEKGVNDLPKRQRFCTMMLSDTCSVASNQCCTTVLMGVSLAVANLQQECPTDPEGHRIRG
jgi:hypothetical protein